MVRLVLNTNCFAFENKYYQQIRGGAMGSPLTMTLTNIYMFEWEQPLIEYQKSRHELYGRYIDDVFMTMNTTFDQINAQLNRMETKDENIRITRSMCTTIEFLNVLVTNDYGQLKTSVFHKPDAEPYILPYFSEHPRHIHRNTIIGALFRAVRLCSNVQDFDNERLHIELSLLLNGYPLKFITHHFKRFFQQYHAISLLEQLDQTSYQLLRNQLLFQPSRRERQQNNEILQEQQDKSKTSDKSTMTVHFTFESGPMLEFKRELHRL